MNALAIGGISGIPYRKKKHILGILGLLVGGKTELMYVLVCLCTTPLRV